MLMLLLSSMIGTAVWAKPGKPPPEPEKFDYQIWIGIGDLNGEDDPEDVVLQPYGVPLKDYLVVENVGYSGRWLPPPTKGKRNNEILYIIAAAVKLAQVTIKSLFLFGPLFSQTLKNFSKKTKRNSKS